MQRNTKKTILITGASSGIGQACARHLLAKGWQVYACQRSAPAAEDIAAGLRYVPMDVTEDASVTQAIAKIVAEAGTLHAILNNAGFAIAGAIEDTSMEEARAQMETNFFGVLRVCRAIAPVLRAQGHGHLVTISSLAGILGLPFSGLYSASKFALEGLHESLRFELRPFGVRVVLIEPGDFDTALPANRRRTQASGPQSAYRAAFEASQTAQAADEAKAPRPERVARLLERILAQRQPKLRHVVGAPGQTIVVPLKRLLPQAWFEAVLRAATGA